ANEQQVGDVSARDEKHERDGRLEQPKHRPIFSNHAVVKRTNNNVTIGIGVGVFQFQISSNDFEIGCCLFDRNALLQPADAVKSKTAVAVMHVRSIRIEAKWCVKIGVAGALGIASGFGISNDRKIFSRDANDLITYRI